MCAPSMDLTQYVELICGEIADDPNARNFGLVERTNEILAQTSIVNHHRSAGHECRPLIRAAHLRFQTAAS